MDAEAEILVYQGDAGPGSGKHIVFIASDHEYHSAETCPALARILAKRFGFKCTVLFGQDAAGHVRPGNNNVPGLENLETADLVVLFTRFQHWDPASMRYFADYVDRGGPFIGLRTATHAFKIPKGDPFEKYDSTYAGEAFKGGFGRQILGETWVNHHGGNHRHSTRLDVVADKTGHPILRGVQGAWAYCGGYAGDPLPPSEILLTAQPLDGITPDSPNHPGLGPVPAGWTRRYAAQDGSSEGRVFTLMYGASNDLVAEGTRRVLVNACLWAIGLEDAIRAEANVGFVGPFTPTFAHQGPKAKPNYKVSDLAGWESPIPPLATTAE